MSEKWVELEDKDEDNTHYVYRGPFPMYKQAYFIRYKRNSNTYYVMRTSKHEPPVIGPFKTLEQAKIALLCLI